MLEEELGRIVKEAVPLMSQDDADSIVTHLTSQDVGVESVEDLIHVTLENMQPLNLAPIRLKKLMIAFKNCGTRVPQNNLGNNESLNDSTPGCSSWGANRQLNPNTMLTDKYKFTLRWASMPQETIKALEASDILKKRAEPEDEDTLKLALVKKVKTEYEAYKEIHPGSQKHPGIEVYKSVALQVFAKFPNCFKDIVNGKEVGDGQASFIKRFGICLENQMRDKKQKTPRQRAVRAKGIVGVLPGEYEPCVSNSTEQESIREHLQNMNKLNPNAWDTAEILRDMMKTYELQREDIVKVKEKVFSPEASVDPDEIPTKALSEIKQLWPFLFETYCLSQHHKRLTGRELLPHAKEFMSTKVDNYMRYMTCASSNNINNLALQLDNEPYFEVASHAPKKLLCLILMLANHFKENKDLFLLPVEKTTLLGEIEIPNNEACIVALDENIFEAEKFFLCVDGVALMEAEDFVGALTALIELCFIFDVQYPKLPHTFEFIERCIFKMAISDTRVKDRRGKELLVLTSAVKDTINGQEKFEEDLRKKRASRNNTDD